MLQTSSKGHSDGNDTVVLLRVWYLKEKKTESQLNIESRIIIPAAAALLVASTYFFCIEI